MMSIEDFRAAPFEKKCYVVLAQTIFIAASECGDAMVYLYHTGEYYIEVYYSPRYQKVLTINAIDDNKDLEPYAEAVSLDDLSL